MTQDKKERCAIDGVLLLDKPRGLTSNAAIQRVKRIFNAQKAGHVGTLDPMASGLLPVCLGEATKFSTDAFSADKSYEAEILLGVTTTTGDCEGEVTSRSHVDVTADALHAVLSRFTGELTQIPPMYSALKRDGKPLYAYARAGVTLERESRAIRIHKLELLKFGAERLTIDVSCSKGTYIRVLAEDIGKALGCGATLAGLRRTRVGALSLASAIDLAALESLDEAGRTEKLLDVDALASALPALMLDAESAARILHGQPTQVAGADAQAGTGMARLYGPAQRFLGLGELQSGGRLLPKRLVTVKRPIEAPGGNTEKS